MLLIVITFAHWVSVGDGNSGFFCVPGGILLHRHINWLDYYGAAQEYLMKMKR